MITLVNGVPGPYVNWTPWASALTGVKTNFAISPTIAATQRLIVKDVTVTLGSDSTSSAGVRIGFAASSLPAEAEAGAAAMVVPHAKIPPGGGLTRPGMYEGAADQELMITSETPTPSALKISYQYIIVSV